jgi:hypothetical protein
VDSGSAALKAAGGNSISAADPSRIPDSNARGAVHGAVRLPSTGALSPQEVSTMADQIFFDDVKEAAELYREVAASPAFQNLADNGFIADPMLFVIYAKLKDFERASGRGTRGE